MSCGLFGMAKKLDSSKLFQEIRGRCEVTNRQPAADLTALYLMHVRSSQLKVAPPIRRRLRVTDAAHPQSPQPVKIIHAG